VRFDYGDEVTLKARDSGGNVTEKPCCVVGVTQIENQEQAKHLNYPVGTILYTVEFSDGTDAFVSENDLRHRTSR
jgi:hypothetical protein